MRKDSGSIAWQGNLAMLNGIIEAACTVAADGAWHDNGCRPDASARVKTIVSVPATENDANSCVGRMRCGW